MLFKLGTFISALKMSTKLLKTLHPPAQNGTKQLDKDAFTVKCNVWTVLFKEPRNIGQFMKSYKKEALNVQRLPFIVKLGDDEVPECLKSDPEFHNKPLKAIVLNDKLEVTEKDEEEEPKEIGYKPQELKTALTPGCIESIQELGGIYRIHKLVFDYDFWKTEEILRAVLPEGLNEDPPSSFTKTGHLAHLNLKDEYKPYGDLIGQVILDKNSSITTVVDKVNEIETKYRTFPMRVIAGEPNFNVKQHESGCEFEFDFSKVYWNSRLSTEHGRLIDGFHKGEAICDAMAGVGPFAIPAAKKGVISFANDLNPESYKYLKLNIEKNKVGKMVIPYNMDGAEFIKQSPKLLDDFANANGSIQQVLNSSSHSKKRKIETRIPHFFSEYAMNLPGSAIEFTPAYRGLFANAFPDKTKEEVKAMPDYRLPVVHVYHFEKYGADESPEPTDEDLYRRVHKKLCGYLNYEIPFEELSFHLVRKVAPTKPMFCVSFKLPEDVAFEKGI